MKDEDDILWERAVQEVKRLSSEPRLPRKAKDSEEKPRVRPAPDGMPVQAQRRHGSELDSRTATRFRKGSMKIEARIDLHGYRLAEAEAALKAFIVRAYSAHQRCVLVVTGKGGRSVSHESPWYEAPFGSIQTSAPGWLGSAALAPFILAICRAQPKHGGEGALYVLLRRQRPGAS